MIMEPSNMRCPRCGKYGYVRSLTGLSELYIAKCTNCNFYISTDDIVSIVSGGSALAESDDGRCDITDERDLKIAELTEKLEAYERTGVKPEEIDPLARTLNKLRTILGCKTLADLERLLDRVATPPPLCVYDNLVTTAVASDEDYKDIIARCEGIPHES